MKNCKQDMGLFIGSGHFSLFVYAGDSLLCEQYDSMYCLITNTFS